MRFGVWIASVDSPCVGPPSRSQCYDHRLYSGTHFLLLELHAEMVREVYGAASAIAAFQLAQLAFAALVKKGILPKAEAEQILRQAIEAMRTAGPGDRA